MITPRLGLVLLGLVLIGATLIYAPGLNGPFVLDDEENITAVPEIAIHCLDYVSLRDAALSNDSGPLKRPLPTLSFALNHYLAGGFESTFGFKLTNLLIHLANTVLIFLFCRALLATPALLNRMPAERHITVAILATALWAFHPIQVTNVLYIVQRMNSLSALFVLSGLILFVHGRTQLNTVGARGFTLMAGGTIGGTALGLASKENAVLLPLFALVIEYSFFHFRTHDERTRRLLLIFYMLVVVLPAVSLAIYLVLNPDFILNSYVTRHFSLLERVLTETRVLWYYAGLILFPISKDFGLFHDDMVLSTGLFTPHSTLFATVGLLAILGLGLSQAKRHPLISFAILWFLAGHVIESSVLGLELAYEHRNYLPSYGILFAAAYGLIFSIQVRRTTVSLAVIAVLLTLGFITWARAGTWGNIQSLAEHAVSNHPNSPRANDFAARTSLGVKNDLIAGIRFTLNGLRNAPMEVGFHIDLQILLGTLGNEIEHKLQRQATQSVGQPLDIRIAGLDEDIQAVETKDGLRLSHHNSSPERISELLGTQAITVHGIFSLENLRHCILDPPKPCKALHNVALSWFAIAAKNSRTSQDYRAIIVNNAAVLQAEAGDVSRALEYINQAVALLPDHVSYRVTRAEYLIKLGRLDEARHAIDLIAAEAAPTDTPVSVHESNIRKLREMYNNAAEEKHGSLWLHRK
ncbi:MAG: hypothetical protein HY052_07160 [Proteobacteria bacterium]|nr:hypothetical protein [Pseudomonadota bacterium]